MDIQGRGVYVNIPIGLCIYSLKKRLIPSFCILIWLKAQGRGTIMMTDKAYSRCMHETGYTKETIRKHLIILLKLKWIGFNAKRNIYHINSFLRIYKRIRKSKRTLRMSGVVWDTDDYRIFRPFVYASIVTYFGKKKRWLDKKRLTGTEIGRPMKSSSQPSFALPYGYLAKILRIEDYTACFIIKTAQKGGYLSLEERFEETNLKPWDIKFHKAYDPNNSSYRVRNGKVIIQNPTVITSTIYLKRKRLSGKRNRMKTTPKKNDRIIGDIIESEG